jgi:hypothetical protein
MACKGSELMVCVASLQSMDLYVCLHHFIALRAAEYADGQQPAMTGSL